MISDEIAKKIRSAKLKETGDLVFEKNSFYIKENPATKAKYGYETMIELIVITDGPSDTLIQALEDEIGYHGNYGDYFVQKIDYSLESPVQALDEYWMTRLSLKIIWEG
jgi:hypothetical protein